MSPKKESAVWSRSDAWRIGFGLRGTAGLEQSDYAVAQAQGQIDGDSYRRTHALTE